MTKYVQIILFIAMVGVLSMCTAEAAPASRALGAADARRSLLRGRAKRGARRLSWSTFIKSVEKDADDVADDVEDAADDVADEVEEVADDVADVTTEGYCDVVKLAAKALITEDITTDAGCALLGTEAALECESAGGGPEDPIADMCAVAIGAAGVAACESAIADGGTFDADALESEVGC